MALWQNLPFFMILFPLASASLTSVLKPQAAKAVVIAVITSVLAASVFFMFCMWEYGDSFTFMMGHFPAPWGNEIRAGILEAAMALCFSFVMLFSLLGGLRDVERDVFPDRQNLYYVMCELCTAALMAQVFTNDVFTGYVFLEIMTIAACALISARSKGPVLAAATQYMILNLVGSGLFLLGLTLLYDLTGHLLMSDIQRQILLISESGRYNQPLLVVVVLITVGLGIKSALYPFHTWVPEAYSKATPASSAILSSLISKAYIFLLIKFYYRVFGFGTVRSTGVMHVLFAFGAVGAIAGSLSAIRQIDIRRMVAFSSVSQIGYIYMAMGLGTDAGMAAALFQLAAHAVCKAMLFIATGGICDASDNKRTFTEQRGVFYRNPAAGTAFTAGALSMIGIPFLSGFAVKISYAEAALERGGLYAMIVLLVLVISTVLNAVYFGKTVITLFRVDAEAIPGQIRWNSGFCFKLSCTAFIAATVFLGTLSRGILETIRLGIGMFD